MAPGTARVEATVARIALAAPGGVERAAPPAPGNYGTRIVSGAMVPILSVISVLFFWFWAWAVYSLVTTGQVLGQALPGDIPFWVGILVLVCVYHAVAWPLHFARRRAAYYSLGGQYGGFIPAWDGALSLTFGILAVWMAYHYIPEVREVIKTCRMCGGVSSGRPAVLAPPAAISRSERNRLYDCVCPSDQQDTHL